MSQTCQQINLDISLSKEDKLEKIPEHHCLNLGRYAGLLAEIPVFYPK